MALSKRQAKWRDVTIDSSLVEEIEALRHKLNERYLAECSFTAASVVELSHQLDVKMNEFMKRMHNYYT
ncbi:MAG: aspartyl-phosphate phosphatase Spo0E family protein [Candidatus Cohnella colombiensis]|uniref:Aspartyl-phosphate phosphatase Spo0E family protein n=1 Tax=Candidatus Cohnella colombiensis TaxID=3121368 RepID=A0AA95JGP4_9BACL|nr:MAG: aspartyl-phosphate phosphatase Spo0E family protein [Cohnella sp.]